MFYDKHGRLVTTLAQAQRNGNGHSMYMYVTPLNPQVFFHTAILKSV